MYLSTKRLIDILLAFGISIVLFPLIAVLAAAVALSSPGGVLFCQERFGAGKRLFTLYKFRTMRHDAPHDVPTNDLKDPERFITPIGRVLRLTSLDELPQLINILKGDMSFIGPRPALWNQYNLIKERDGYVGRWKLTPNDLRPGLTGWAQVNGRDLLNDAEKARFDGEYAKNISFWFDVRCFFETVLAVFRAAGVSEGGKGAKSHQDRA